MTEIKDSGENTRRVGHHYDSVKNLKMHVQRGKKILNTTLPLISNE